MLRGKWILEEVLGTPPPPPPPLVATLPPDDRVTEGRPSVSGWRRIGRIPIALGLPFAVGSAWFALENFDPVGRWRTEGGWASVDAAGTLANGESVAGPAELKKAPLARKGPFVRHLTEKMLSTRSAAAWSITTSLRSTDVRQVGGGLVPHGHADP